MGASNDLHSAPVPTPTPSEQPRIVPRRLWLRSSWLLGQIAQHAHRIVMERVEQSGLRKQHVSVLTALEEFEAPTQAALVRDLAIDGSDMVAVLDDLERRGFVERRRDDADRRRNVLSLTPAGRKALHEVDAQLDAAQDEVFAPLDGEEREQLRELLTRVLEHHRATR
jgi:DNA-binding MarR family transcriptional regulator